jgi:uncharacterized protein (DUF2147 family)
MSFLAMSLSALKAGAVAVALWTVAGFGSGTAQAEEPTASGQPEAWFRIVDCGGTYEGQIVKMFPRGQVNHILRNGAPRIARAQKNAPALGITLIKGMQRHGLTILDPRDGSLYSARMGLSPDGNQLTVRGYLGISLLGQSQVWRRIPNVRLEGSPGRPCTHDPRPG